MHTQENRLTRVAFWYNNGGATPPSLFLSCSVHFALCSVQSASEPPRRRSLRSLATNALSFMVLFSLRRGAQRDERPREALPTRALAVAIAGCLDDIHAWESVTRIMAAAASAAKSKTNELKCTTHTHARSHTLFSETPTTTYNPASERAGALCFCYYRRCSLSCIRSDPLAWR
jgi:hypothetical protein